ncbi:MAG TPA: beta-ketoacyl-ACP synthase II [Thermoanaerobaculia bacterium]|nr:beta-ketoacyl-ACP synthase II [Thermoanaerobaculia bacterium]
MRRVVVTGMGAITPIGNSLDRLWDGVLAAASGVSEIRSFDVSDLPVRFAAQVGGFDPVERFGVKEARQIDRFTQFALASGEEALQDSGLDLGKEDLERIGCIWATSVGGLAEVEKNVETLLTKGPRRLTPHFIPKFMPNSAAGHLAIRFGLRGTNFAVVSACASGQHALGVTLRSIQAGDADVVLTGASDASVNRLGMAGFCAMRALSQRNDDPATASRPFNLDRDGFVAGEGAGALVLEEMERARARGARIYGEILGWGSTNDAHHISAPLPDGAMACRAMQIALKDGRVGPGDVDYVNAHGTSTPFNDVVETRAIRSAFGPHADRLMVSSSKSQIGHLVGAAGAVEAVITLLGLHHQVAPPTINYRVPDPECDLDYVPNEPRPARLRRALSNSFGFGGHNASVLFGTV